MVLLFDIDGTLINTQKGLMQRIVKEAIINAGYTIRAVDDSFAGRTDIDIFSSLTDHPSPDFEVTTLSYFTHLEKNLKPEHVKEIDGVSDCLLSLQKSPYHLALLTGNYKDSAFIKLQRAKLHEYFNWDISAFGQDGSNRNDLPIAALERIQTHIKDFKQEKDLIFVIGDTPKDIECAKHAGFVSVAIATGGYSAQSLAQHNPDLLLENLSDLEEMIQDFESRR